MAKLVLTLALLAVAAPALARDRAVPEATPTGKPLDCLSTLGLQSHVRSDRVIDFVAGRKTYRNTLPYSCPSLGFEERFSYRISSPRLCSLDIITVIQGPGISAGASCGLGKFQPVELVKAAR